MSASSDNDNASMLPDALIDVLKDATEVVALTGAGVSAESGVPTFSMPPGRRDDFPSAPGCDLGHQ